MSRDLSPDLLRHAKSRVTKKASLGETGEYEFLETASNLSMLLLWLFGEMCGGHSTNVNGGEDWEEGGSGGGGVGWGKEGGRRRSFDE